MLARRVNSERWAEATAAPTAPLCADPLVDLNTQDNALSVWVVSDDLTDIKRIVLAITSTFKSPSKCDLVVFPEGQITARGRELMETEGNTPIPSLNGLHRDIVGLEAADILGIAEELRTAQFEFFPLGDVARILSDAIEAGEVSIDQLKGEVPQYLRKRGFA